MTKRGTLSVMMLFLVLLLLCPAAFPVVGPDRVEPIRLRVRQRSKHEHVDGAEDGRAGTDPDAEGQHRDGDEETPAAECAKAVLEILPDPLHQEDTTVRDSRPVSDGFR